MSDLTPDHPAVEAASMAPYEGREWAADLERMHDGQSFREARKPGLAAALNAAFPHLTAATEENLSRLRNTPVGRALMAEGWEEGALHQARGSAETRRVLASALPNPYEVTPNE